MIAPERGRILDRKMRLLAGNMDGFSLVLKWDKSINVDEVIKKTLTIVKINQKDFRFHLDNIFDKVSLIPIFIDSLAEALGFESWSYINDANSWMFSSSIPHSIRWYFTPSGT